MAKAPPSPQEAAAALVAGAQAKSTKYQSRTIAAANTWSTNAAAAGPQWQGGVTAPGVQQRLTAGIRRAGAQGFAQGVTEKGATRYSPGVAAGQGKYAARVAPYFALITNTALPAKGIRGSASNIERVRVLAAALNSTRAGTSAAG